MLQGATSVKDGVAYSMVLDEDNGDRGYMDEHVVITRSGGGMGVVDGKMVQAVDHQHGGRLIAPFVNSCEQKWAVQLVVGEIWLYPLDTDPC